MNDPIPKPDGNHLEHCRKLMTNYDNEMAEDWKEGINTQLLVVRLRALSLLSYTNQLSRPFSLR